ncbi:MAG TPA: hypothetical protein VL354_04855 [Spirochaetia bacterium]|nr:hypothetical protein [Spirochaetia bacterium]
MRRQLAGMVFDAALAAALFLMPPAPVSAQPLRWEQAETEHFLFVYEPRDQAAVNELLTFCEPIYQRITGFFHSYPKKVPVVIRGRIDEANGFSTFLPMHIELYVTAPTDHALGARTESWLKLLLTHELTHYVHATMDRGFFYALSRVFGADAAGAHFAFLPGWMIEGPSTNNETMFTQGGRGRNPLFEMYDKAPVEQGNLFSLEQAAYDSAFPPPGRIYVGGYLLVDFLLSTYGQDAFRRIMDEYLGFPFFGPWAAIQKVTGKSASQVFADLKAHLEQKYQRDREIPSGSVITPDRIGDWIHPQRTEAGLYVFHSSQDLSPSIVRFDPTTGKETVLHSAVNDGLSFSATQDGETIYFSSLSASFVSPVDEQITSDLFQLDVKTGSLRQMTHDGHLWQPSVSPDGEHLIAVQGVGPYSRLVSVDRRSGELRTLFSRTEANVYTPSFSPDGKRVAFTFNVRGFQDIYVADYERLREGSVAVTDNRSPVDDINLDGARPVLGPDPFGEYFPAFLDDDTVLFSSDREGSLSLYRADLRSGDVARVFDDPVAVISAVPDGDTLIYSSYSSNGRCLKRVPLAGLRSVSLRKDQMTGQDYPASYAWTGSSTSSQGYLDWPAPLLWLPFPTLTRTSPGSPGVEIGLGAAVYGASLLGTTTWFADAGWSFGAQQPFAGLTLTTALGPFLAELSSQLTYQYTDLYSQTVETNASLSLPVVNDARFDVARLLSISLGLEHLAELDSATPFTISQATSALTGSWQNSLFVTNGISWQWQKTGGAIDFDSPLAANASLQNATRLPVLYSPVPESDFTLQVGLNIPSPIPHQVIILGVKSVDVLGGPFDTFTDSFAVPRGFPGPSVRTVPGQAVASIDYAIPIGLFDQPLPFSLAVTGMRIAVHAEGLAQWADGFQGFAVEPFMYVGGDMSFRMAFNAIPFVVVLGVTARITTSAPSSFDPARDIGIYLSVGTAGLAGGLNAGVTPKSRGQVTPRQEQPL